jgi:hypothetical protein
VTNSKPDREILRRLAVEWIEIASLPVQQETIAAWKALNGLKAVRPMVYIKEIPWNEMDVDGELKLHCRGEFNRAVEQRMRRELYRWRHVRGDLVLENAYDSPVVVQSTGFGLEVQENILRVDERNTIVSHHYQTQIHSLKDVEKLVDPQISIDQAATDRNFNRLSDLFGDILPVRRCGIRRTAWAPWDRLVTWWGTEPALMALVERPELAHALMQRFLEAMLSMLDQYESLNLLDLPGGSDTGSGGPGFTDELPQPGYDPAHIRAIDQWGMATSQIFSTVSARTHAEFAVQYERQWLARFGLNYYGCCEPLDSKVDILRAIPRLRKISMSPWVNIERAAHKLGSDFVYSYKPNPALVASEGWDAAQIRCDLRHFFEVTRGCQVEVILKDISTVRYQPQRLWDFAEIAHQEANAFA